MFTDIMGIVIDTEDKWLNKKLNSHICYKGGVSGMGSTSMPEQGVFGRLTEASDSPSGGLSSSSSSGGLDQGSAKVAEARTKLEGALGALQGLKDGSSGVCSCGKPKGKCNCKGYANGIKFAKSKDQAFVSEEFKKNMDKGMSAKDAFDAMIKSHQKQGYAYGTKMASPMGYYMGDAAVEEQQEMMAMQPMQGTQAQINPNLMPQEEPSIAQELASTAGQKALSESVDVAKEKVMETGPMQSMFGGSGVAGLGKAAAPATDAVGPVTEAAAKGSAGMQALGGAGTAVVGDLITKGKVDSGTLKKAALGAVGNMLLPGVGGVIGSALGGMFKDGTPDVPSMGGVPRYKSSREKMREKYGNSYSERHKKMKSSNSKKSMGYADGSRYAMQAAEKAKMSPEEFQKKFLEERIVEPAKAFLEERPMMSAPLFMVAAARDFEEGKLPLGKFGGGRLEGGKDRIAYRHKKYGDFEFNPESERVSYKKTFRF